LRDAHDVQVPQWQDAKERPLCVEASLVGLPGKKRQAYNGIDNQ
jgi:hypothetical protein